MRGILNTEIMLMAAAVVVLLAVDWLAFHDFRETHTVRDWLTLFASILVFVQFARVFWQRRPAQQRNYS